MHQTHYLQSPQWEKCNCNLFTASLHTTATLSSIIWHSVIWICSEVSGVFLLDFIGQKILHNYLKDDFLWELYTSMFVSIWTLIYLSVLSIWGLQRFWLYLINKFSWSLCSSPKSSQPNSLWNVSVVGPLWPRVGWQLPKSIIVTSAL